MEPLGLYIHIPFCLRKCKYCDFLSAPAGEETMRQYAEALVREIRLRGEKFSANMDSAGRAPLAADISVGRGSICQNHKKYPVDTVFLGGGTPTALPADCLLSILRAVRESFDVLPGAEITCEVNPGTFSPELLGFLAGEISRVSLGLQSVHDRELQLLGRIHNYLDFLDSYKALRAAGAANVSVDLMFGLPGQTLADFEGSLRTVVELSPEHVSCYGLILEEGTPFFVMEEKGLFTGNLSLPDEELERQMYRAANRILGEYGYQRYEISNYAKPGFESRHNLRYWQRRPYLGFGIGAASLYGKRRWSNTRELDEYLPILLGDAEALSALSRDVEVLSVKAEMEECMFLGLRMDRGVSEKTFASLFGRELSEVYGDVLRKLEAQGLLSVRMEADGSWWSLTERGVDISNRVLAEFLLDE